jgi:hypothetical protein
MQYYNSLNSFESKQHAYSAYDESYVTSHGERFHSENYADKDLDIFLTLLRGKSKSLVTQHNWEAYLFNTNKNDKQQRKKYVNTHKLLSFDTTQNDEVNVADSLIFQVSSRHENLDMMEMNAEIDLNTSLDNMCEHFMTYYLIDLRVLAVTIFGQKDESCLSSIPSIIEDEEEISTIIDFLLQCALLYKDKGYSGLYKILYKNNFINKEVSK